MGTMAKFKPPITTVPIWAVVYGDQDIVLGYCEDEETANQTADALNVQAPQYNHRAKEL